MTPRECPVCASYRDDSSSRCVMKSKYLNIMCYSPNDPYKPQHSCSWCQKPLHSGQCSFVEQGKEVCLTCMEQTRHVEDSTVQTTTTTTTTKRALASTSAKGTELASKRRKKNSEAGSSNKNSTSTSADTGTGNNCDYVYVYGKKKKSSAGRRR